MSTRKHHSPFSRFFLLCIVVVIGVWGTRMWWNDSISSVDPADTTPMAFLVRPGDGVKMIATRLGNEKLIRSSTGFFVLVKLMGIEKDLQAGEFRLSRSMTASEIARELTHGISDIWVTTLEGWRSEEIATALAKNMDIPEQEFLKVAREGYMFPDTYLIPRDATAAGVAKLFMDNFDKKVTPLVTRDAKSVGLTFDEVIVLASIVEREGRSDADRPTIAGILLKRMKEDWPLQADATLQYMLGYQSAEKTWWKKSLTDEDKKVPSPYNTYKNTGLPKRPISNPGLAAITAVLHPKENEYWYYLHDSTGVVHFAKTLEEHEANIRKYL